MSNNYSYQKTPEELREAAVEQIEQLQSSCTLYDSGKLSEAPRMATCLFNLVNDGSTPSLLTKINLRKKIEYVSYVQEPTPGNLLADEFLVILQMGNNTFSYLPKLDQGPFPPNLIKFHHWWEKEIIFQTPIGQKLNRRKLVFALRNKDGGSHVDSRLDDEAYMTFSRENRWVLRDASGQITLAIPRPHQATIRHISFEFLKSVESIGLR